MIIRVEKKPEEKIQIHKYAINEDTSLSWGAKGIYTYLMGHANDWIVMEEDLIKHATNGRDAVRGFLRELRQRGYIMKQPIFKDGHIDGWESVISELPVEPKKWGQTEKKNGQTIKKRNGQTFSDSAKKPPKSPTDKGRSKNTEKPSSCKNTEKQESCFSRFLKIRPSNISDTYTTSEKLKIDPDSIQKNQEEAKKFEGCSVCEIHEEEDFQGKGQEFQELMSLDVFSTLSRKEQRAKVTEYFNENIRNHRIRLEKKGLDQPVGEGQVEKYIVSKHLKQAAEPFCVIWEAFHREKSLRFRVKTSLYALFAANTENGIFYGGACVWGDILPEIETTEQAISKAIEPTPEAVKVVSLEERAKKRGFELKGPSPEELEKRERLKQQIAL